MANKKRPTKKSAGSKGPAKAKPQAASDTETEVKTSVKKKSRDERFADARKQRRRKKRLTNVAVSLAIAVPLIAVVAWGVNGWLDQRNVVKQMTQASCKYDTRTDPGQTGEHSNTPPPYSVDPPSGGVHLPTAASAGDYSASGATLPADGLLVHALEHGYIDIWYKPDLQATDLQTLKDLQKAHSRDVLLIPRASMSVPVAATAWQKRLLCQTVEPTSFAKFIDAYVNKGPEKIPH